MKPPATPSGDRGTPRTQRSHPPSSTSPQGPGGSSASPLAPTAPGILLKQHGHCSRGSAAVVQPGGRRGGAANPRLAPLGTVLSALGLVSNIDSSPEGLIHLQVSAYILYIFIFVRHLVSLKSTDRLPSKGMSLDEILSVEQLKFSPKHPPITYNILPPVPSLPTSELENYNRRGSANPEAVQSQTPTRAELHVLVVPHQ